MPDLIPIDAELRDAEMGAFISIESVVSTDEREATTGLPLGSPITYTGIVCGLSTGEQITGRRYVSVTIGTTRYGKITVVHDPHTKIILFDD